MVSTTRSLAPFLAAALLAASAACARAELPGAASAPTKETALAEAAGTPERGARVTVVGVRATQGDAVECPQIRADDGTTYGVASLESSIALGARVSVTGVWAVSARCRGRVINAETVEVLSGD